MGNAWYRLLPLCVVLCALPARAQDGGYFQQNVQYEMHVSLDTGEKMLTGAETIRYTNNSPDALDRIYIHLYPNAYRNRHTPFMEHYRRRFNLNIVDVPSSRRGWLEISDVSVDGQSVEVRIDETVARIDLPSPLPPGSSVNLSFDFESKVRKQLGRAGYSGDHYDFAQWYPKVAVYDENGWHADPWVTGEFYGEFGSFDVHLDVPDNFVIAATGVLKSGDAGWDYNPPGEKNDIRKPTGRKTVHFQASDVHDFAWCADPTYVVESASVGDVDVHSFYRRSNASTWADSSLAHGVRAIEWLERKFGKYPYPQVSVCDALLGGGMEYPMLVMDGTANESLVVHEIGHIYFFGILANDEFKEAWMDEGFTTFQTQWFKESRYGPWGDRGQLNWYQRMTPQYKLWEGFREQVFYLQRRGYGERVSRPSDEYVHSYGTHVYRKAALVLNAVQYAAGEQGFDQIMQDYYDKWQLKHVNEERFRGSVEEFSHTDLTRQFEQWLHTRKTVDYRLTGVKTREIDGRLLTQVEIQREGELYLPIEVHFKMEDGSVEKRRVDGKLRNIKQTFELPGRPKSTAVNPDNEIMDVDPADNFSPRRYKIGIDLPNNHYYAEDGYSIRHHPFVWYNDVDEYRVGWHFSGSHYNWSRKIKLGLYYGTLSERFDFSAAYQKPMMFLGRRGDAGVSGYKLEGRQDVTVRMEIFQRPQLSVPPTQKIVVAYNYHELTDPDYLVSPEIYDTNMADTGFYFSYQVDPQLDIASTNVFADFKLGRDWTWGDYDYERFSTDVRIHSRSEYFPLIDLRMRGFLGLIGGNMPTQQKFQLAGAGPLQQEKRFWLRSPGAVPADLNYHEPGDGNLRGYLQGGFGVNQLAAFNVEAGTRLKLWYLDRLIEPLLGKVWWYGFYDAGRSFDDANPIGSSARVEALYDSGVLDQSIQDAGIGLRSHRIWPFWDLWMRLDMPFWVNQPNINGEVDQTQFRYIFSISTTF